MREERIDDHGVPGRLYAPAGASGLLLFGHGGGRSKDDERIVRLSRLWAEETGLAVVCIDAVDHGDRRPAGPAGSLPARWHSTVAGQVVRDWQATAGALDSIGPPVAYVGFSMGAIFGALTAAALPSIRAAVLASGGIPTGAGIDDPPLRPMLLGAAAGLGHVEVLMTNVTGDEVFRTEDTHALFDAIPGTRKRLVFWAGRHDDWPLEAIRLSVAFLREHAV